MTAWPSTSMVGRSGAVAVAIARRPFPGRKPRDPRAGPPGLGLRFPRLLRLQVLRAASRGAPLFESDGRAVRASGRVVRTRRNSAKIDVTRILAAIEHGEPEPAEKPLPWVHEQLRTWAAQGLAQERPGQILQTTASDTEAHLRLEDPGPDTRGRDGRIHVLAAGSPKARLQVRAIPLGSRGIGPHSLWPDPGP